MGFEFAYPWALLLLVPAFACVVLINRRYRLGGLSLKRKVCLAARLLLVGLLVLSAAAPSVLLPSGSACRWFLLDVSDSAKAQRDALTALARDGLQTLPDGQRAGVIAYGREAMVETPLSDHPALGDLRTVPGADGTDLDGALRLASALLGGSGGLTVLSDGKGEVSTATLGMLRGLGIPVDVLVLQADAGTDAQVTALSAPARAFEGQSVTLNAVIDATEAMEASLELYQNGKWTASRTVSLLPGENRFAFADTAQTSGVVSYEARLVSAQDTQPRNNSASAYTRVTGAPKVIIASTESGMQPLLSAAGFLTEQADPASLPASAAGYLAYDAIVLDNVSYDSLNERQWQALDDAVRILGRGLCVLGGDESYALGGYRGTLLEELLPVRIDVRNKLRMPALSLVIAIDKSGSMADGLYGYTRIEVAKEAAMGAIEALNSQDYAGVIGFDEAAMWVVPFQPVEDLNDLQAQIGTLRASGGTAFYSALDEAYQALASSQTPQKHVIFLSDGQPGDSHFESLALGMSQAGITLTTVAVGQGADVKLMELLSTLGGGRCYQVGEFDSIPKIFTKETILAGGSYVQNRSFVPVVSDSSAFMGLDALPMLEGYLTTVEKTGATVALRSDTDDPLLAYGHAGAGTVLCWTSDAHGAWTSAYLAWEDAPRFFGNMVTRVLPAEDGGSLTARVNDGKMEIVYETETAEGASAMAEVSMPDGTAQSVSLVETAPGEYRGSLEANAQGVYALRATLASGGQTVYAQEGGAVVGFSSEYDLRAVSSGWEALALETGGRLLAPGEGFYQTPVQSSSVRKSLQELLCVLSLLWLLADIALRKLPWDNALSELAGRPPRKAQTPKRSSKQPASPTNREEPAQDTVGALLAAKRAHDRRESVNE